MPDNRKLSALGIDPATLTDEQQGVIDALSPEEVNVLSSIKHRLDTVGGDVQGHSDDGGGEAIGGLIW
jgi:hypothetical protein